MNQKKLLNQKIQRFKEKFNKSNIFIKYTIIFLFVMLIGLIPIEVKNGSFLFSGLFTSRVAGIDGLKQHLVFMNDFISHFKDNIFNGGISLFRFDIGLGSDMINHYSYYSLFDPLMLIAYIIPLKHVEASYYILIILRLYLTGVAGILLAKKLDIKKHNALLTVGILFVFNVAVLFSAFRHPMFINGPMYFALIIYGYEKLKRKESPVVLILSVFFGFISQFYILIYTTFGFIVFELIDFLRDYKKSKIKDFIKYNLYYFLGVMLGGFVLFTQVYATLSGARLGSKGFELYQALDYAAIILSNIIPAAGDHYTAGIGNFFVFIICLYVLYNEKKKSTYKIFFIILISLSLSAIFSYLINMASYVVNRWMYLIILPASIIVGKYIEDNQEVDETNLTKSLRILYTLIIYGIFFVIAHALTLTNISDTALILIDIALVVIALFLSFKVMKINFVSKTFKKILSSSNLYKYVIYNSLVVTLLVSGIYCFTLTPKNALNTYYEDKDLYKDVLVGDEFFRVEQDTYVAGVKDFSNDGIYYGYASTSSYNSMTSGSVLEFIKEYNVVNNNNSVGYNGFNNRTRLLAINHVKYVIIRESDDITPPYGFSYLNSIDVIKYDENLYMHNTGGNALKDSEGNLVYEKANIYVNNLFLNFGVVFKDYLTDEDTKDLNSVEKELLLLNTIVLDEDTDKISKYNQDLSQDKVIVSEFETNNLEVVGKGIKASKDGTLSFKIPVVEDKEVYIEVSGIESVDYKKSFRTTYAAKDNKEIVQNYGYTSSMYIENKNHLVNLGYYENEEDLEVTISFEEGIYEFVNIGYYLIDTNELEEDINLLNTNGLKDVEFSASCIKGKIDTEVNGYMYLSIPYSKGFKAFIDGKEVELLKANKGYMAVYVDSDDAELIVEYTTPGLEIGLFISALALIIFALIVRNQLLHKITTNYQTNKNEEENEKNSTVY